MKTDFLPENPDHECNLALRCLYCALVQRKFVDLAKCLAPIISCGRAAYGHVVVIVASLGGQVRRFSRIRDHARGCVKQDHTC